MRLLLVLIPILLTGCGIVSTTVMVTGAAVGVTTTAAGVADHGAIIIIGKRLANSGEPLVAVMRDELADAQIPRLSIKRW
jgi:hypothetical protein